MYAHAHICVQIHKRTHTNTYIYVYTYINPKTHMYTLQFQKIAQIENVHTYTYTQQYNNEQYNTVYTYIYAHTKCNTLNLRRMQTKCIDAEVGELYKKRPMYAQRDL